MSARRANMLRGILALSAMAGGFPIDLGIPGRPEFARGSALPLGDGVPCRALEPFLGPEPKRKLRPLAERKARRQKRKQRRHR